ncbi:MAG: TonB C-terminal domain-containing protein [Candidatus Rokubacteria bacterium]|nr:TonB C-terminal domain-containing protein [Candidatus Rokubacteria bacterium]
MAYRVPRRFIAPPDEPPPYGLLLLSFVGHAFFLLMAGALSAYVNAQADQSKIYVVNLVPDSAPLGSPAPRVVESPRRVEERTPPKPEKLEAPRPRETPPPKPEKAELPAPKPAKEPPAPPRSPEVARAAPSRPAELALPRKAEKETPALENPVARERLIERPLPPPAPAPTRTPEPPRVTPTPAPPPPPVAVAPRPGVDAMPLGRPDSTTRATSSISLDVSDFPFTYYLRQLQAKISERWAPPRGATAGGERAVVVFEIGRDGQIKEPSVERSSGNAIYDQSALRAIMDASPFPPLPPEFRAPSLRVHFGFEFRPEQG